MHQFDVKADFLHSTVEEEVYLQQPQEFEKRGTGGETLVCRLNKSIYCWRQAAKNWCTELANFVLRQVFTRSRNDHCLFARAETEGHTLILVWVDDIIVASRSMKVNSDVKKTLKATFRMESRGKIHWFLGIRIRREDSTEQRLRSGPEDLQTLGWITSVSGQTDEARHLVHSQNSVQTHECTYQSILHERKTTFTIRFKRFKAYLHKRS